MNRSASIRTGLCLSALEIAALSEGRAIAAISRTFVRAGQQFVLYPHDAAAMPLLSSSHQLTLVSTQPNQLRITLESWAQCELCQILDASSPLQRLAELTQYPLVELQEIVHQRNHLFLVYLRVYRFPHAIALSANLANSDKVGKFIVLPTGQVASELYPAVSDRAFAQRKHQLENLEPPEHSELEELHRAIAPLAIINPNVKAFVNDIESFLGWSETLEDLLESSGDTWMQEIAKTGNSSDGDRFEKLVRRSFIELGFSNSLSNSKASLDPESSGGAGGIDIYCQSPYPLVGECKASKHENVPNSVSAQLIHLGHTHLGKAQFDQSLKVLFVAGRLTDPAQKAAVENQMNVMHPETLERLVTLKAKHSGAINLFDLKACLEATPFGEESDGKVNRYIDQSWQQVKLRSHVIGVVKKHLETMREKIADVNALHVAYLYSFPPQSLERDELKDILIELSSPLTGYLGRKKGSDGSDRFYFLRDLPI